MADRPRVETEQDIIHNLLVLDRYKASPVNSYHEYYNALIRRGSCFVICTHGTKVLFGPSRFVGYKKNTKRAHEPNNSKHGTRTNLSIQQVLKEKFRTNQTVEKQYIEYCQLAGISPSKKKRKYLVMKMGITETDVLLDDLDEIGRGDDSNTEKSQLVQARLGQGKYRNRLLKLWAAKCSVTGCAETSLLRASHIKPWRSCEKMERLDKYNGLLLIPNLDVAFDRGLITFSKTGKIMISKQLGKSSRQKTGINATMVVKLKPQHEKYMAYHRENLFLA